jgi:hypothetical protein
MVDAGQTMSQVEALIAETRRAHATDTESPTYDYAVILSFNRAWGLFQSMKTLLAYKFAEEAAVLGRPLMEESLRLLELAAAGPNRAATALGWLNDSLTRRLKLIQEARDSGKGTEEEEERAKAGLQKRKRQLADYQRRLGISKLRKFPPTKALADKHGRRDEYWDYLLMQLMVHGGELAQALRTTREPESTVGFHDRATDPSWIAAVALSGAQSMLYGYIATCEILGWPESSQGRDRLAQLQQDASKNSQS